MADQLSLNITTPGADAAVSALRSVQAAAQQAATSIQQAGAAASQAGAATTQLATQVTAAGTAAQGAHGAFLSLGSSLGALPGPLGEVGRGFGALSVSLNQAQIGLVAVGGAMMAAGAGIASGLGEAIKEATQYQRTFAEVQVVSQATAAEMEALQNKAIELGASTQFNSQKIAKAFYELSSAGLTVTESLQAIEPITRMATLGNLDLGKSAEDVVKILRQYSLDAGQTSHVVDVLTVAVQGSILHWNEVGEAYRNIAGRAHGMNVSLEETTGALMVASNAGLTAAMAGTAVGTFLDRLAKGSGEAGAAIAQLKLRLYDEQGAFVGLNAVVRQVAEATSGMTEAESNSVLSKLAGARASGFLRNALAQELPVMIDGNQVRLKGADLLDYYTQQAKNADGASRKAAETIQQTLDAQLKVLSGTIQEVGIRLGTEFIPALSAIVPQVTSLINAFVQAPPNIHATAAALLAVASATTIAAGGFLTATAVAAAFGTTLAAAAAAAVAAAAPILAIGAAIALLSVAWINDWGNIRETTTAAATVITAASTQTVTDLTTIYDYLTNILIPRWQQWVDVQTKPPPREPAGTRALAPVEGLTPGVNPALNPADAQSDIALATERGAYSGQAWSKGYVASITEDASGEKIAGILLLDPSAMNAQGGVAGGAMGTGFSDEFTNTVTNGSKEAFSTTGSLWSQMLDNMKKEAEAKQLEIKIFDAESHRAELYEQGALSANIVGKAMGETLAANLDIGLAVQMAMDRILASVKGNIGKAVQEAAAEGNQAAVAGFLQEETMRAAVTATIKEMDAARRAEILTMQAQQGTFETLLHLYDSGAISTEAYQQALDGVVASHAKAKTASEEHKAALQSLIQSTDAAAVSQGLYEQHLDDFIEKTARSLPAIEGQARALINAGDSMGALAVEARELGLSQETLIQASQGVVAAQNAVKAALEGVTGSHEKAKTAAKTHAEAIRELVQSSDASLVAIGLEDQAYDKFATATLPKLTPAIQAQVIALRNAGDSMGAAAVAGNAFGATMSDVSRIVGGQKDAVAAWAAAMKGEAIPTMSEWAKAMFAATERMNSARNAAVDYGLGLDAADKVLQRATQIQKEWQAALDEDIKAGRAAAGALVPLRDAFAQAADEIKSTAQKVKDTANALKVDVFNAFQQVGDAAGDGIQSGLSKFNPQPAIDRLNAVMKVINNEAMIGLRAHSPSQLWADTVGAAIPAGIALGIDQGMPAVLTAVQTGLSQMQTAGETLATGLGQGFETGMTGVIASVGDFARKAAGAFDASLVFSGGRGSPNNPSGSAAAQDYYAQIFQREGGYSPGTYGLGPQSNQLDMQKASQAHMAALQSYWESAYGTQDPAKAQAAYQATLPAGVQQGIIYQNLMNQSVQSLFGSMMQGLPLAQAAMYQQQAAGSPEAMLRTLQSMWTAGGGGMADLQNILNKDNTNAGINPLLGPSANAILAHEKPGPAAGVGSGTFTAGTGFAQAPAAFAHGIFLEPSGSRDYGTLESAAQNAQQYTAMMTQEAKDLANGVSLVSLSWSSIADISKYIASSMSTIPGAFSAMTADFNAASKSSITGSWTTPKIGGPSGPMEGPGANPAGIPSGSTQGGANFAALQALAAQITAEHPDLSADSQARLIQQGMRTNQDYLRVVGNLTDTSDDLRRQQEDAQNQVFNLTSAAAALGGAYAQGTGISQQLADAQAHLADVTNQLASTVTAPVVAPPTPQQPTTPVPTTAQIASLTTGQFYTLNSAGQLVVSTAQNLSGGPAPTPTTGGIPAMAEGGIVNRPTLALVGERGPEAVVPLGRAGGVNLVANITINNAASTPQLAAVLVRQIREEFRRQGTDVSRIGGL